MKHVTLGYVIIQIHEEMPMKYALVTGSTKGIGKAIALRLLRERKDVFVMLNYAHDDDAAMALSKILVKAYPKRFAIIKADLAEINGLEHLLKAINDITHSIDMLIVNAAVTNRKPYTALTLEDWNTVMNTNLTIPFFLTQKLSDKINTDGRIIFISSILGDVPHSLSIPYGVTKAGISMLSRMLVKEYGAKNITVNAIAPGFVMTAWQEAKGEEIIERISDKIALHRFADPEEIAQLVQSVIENGYINGSVIHIDGGYNYQ